MASDRVRVVLHPWKINGRVWADDSFVLDLRADGVEVDVEVPEPGPEPTTTFHGDSAVDYLVEHVHLFLPAAEVAASAAGIWLAGKIGDEAWEALKTRVRNAFVKSSRKQIRARPEFRHQRTVTIYGPDGRPVSEVTVMGHADEEPEIIERHL